MSQLLLERSKGGLPIDIFVDIFHPDEETPRRRPEDLNSDHQKRSVSYLTARTRREFSGFARPSLSKHFTLFGGSAPRLTRFRPQSPIPRTRLSFGGRSSVLDRVSSPFCVVLPVLENLSLRTSGPSGDPSQWISSRIAQTRTAISPLPLSEQASLSLAAGRSRSDRTGSKDKDVFAESNADTFSVCILITMPDVSAPVRQPSMHTLSEASPLPPRKQVSRTLSLVP
ncbi:hypothetical protein BU15DRAFT_84424 [Melanogaster broomeanus]|nr:hypothetical protein BU15DRAFT_84424 [Melanogaster broomeanus]